MKQVGDDQPLFNSSEERKKKKKWKEKEETNQKLPELGRQRVGPVRDMQISNNQDKLYSGWRINVGFFHCIKGEICHEIT